MLQVRAQLKATLSAMARGAGTTRGGHSALVNMFERLALVIVWAATIAVFGYLRPDSFLTWSNFATILGSQAVIVVTALGLIIPLTAGDYDLSIANNLTFAATLLAVLNVNHGLPIGVAIALAVASGLAMGLVNGFFVLYFRMNSLIVTMGVGTFAHGLTLWLGDQQTIGGVSESLVSAVIVDRWFGVPLGFYYAVGLCAILWYYLSYTAAGRRLLFVGRGREVARLSGIAVDRVRLGGFLCSGLLGAVAGVLYVGTTGAADPSSGLSFLLPAFAAAFLGATSINPGRFNPWGTIISVYFLVTGITGLSILGVSNFVQDLFYGGALVIAVTLSQIVRGREERLA
jgi:ribose transport system permease protein